MKKWIVLTAGVTLQLIFGGLYAWSAFVPALTEQYGLSNGECGFIFGVIIAVFTIVMIPGGRLMHRWGPRIVATAGAVLFSSGYVAASFSGGNFILLLLSIGVLSGAGIGAGYVCPLSVGMKWFPNNKGLITGVSVAGFGGGAIVLSFFVQYFLQTVQLDVLQVFRIIGLGFGGVALVSSLMLSEPGRTSEGDGEKQKPKGHIKVHLLTKKFGALALGMFAATFAGLLTVGNLKPILQDAGLEPTATTLGIALFAVGNASGRIIWGQLYDRIGPRPSVLFSLFSLGMAVVLFVFVMPAPYMLILSILTGLGFGAAFVIYASSIVEYFGVERFPFLYPLCFLGYGLSGIIAPGFGGWIKDVTGSFAPAIGISAAVVFLSWVLVAVTLPAARKVTSGGAISENAAGDDASE